MNEITSSYDQGVPLPDGSQEFFTTMYNHYKNLFKDKDVDGLTRLLKQIHDMQRVSGITLAKMLYWMHKDWDKWGIEVDFMEFTFEYLGYALTTIDRYVAIGRLFSENYIPEHHVEMLTAMPLKNLVPIAKTVEQGYEISDEQWEDLALSPDDSSVRKVVRSIKGKLPRKHSLVITLDSDGDIQAFFGSDATPVYIGYLAINVDDEKVQQAISRIVDNAGILRRDHA